MGFGPLLNSIGVGAAWSDLSHGGSVICFKSEGLRSNCQESLLCSAWKRTVAG
jgi:hypothetical protein